MLSTGLAMVAVSALSAAAGVVFLRNSLSLAGVSLEPSDDAPLVTSDSPVVFLFKDQRLVDATDAARAQFTEFGDQDDWDRFIATFAERFPGLHQLPRLPEPTEIAERPHDPQSPRLAISVLDETVRVELHTMAAPDETPLADAPALEASDAELSLLRQVAEDSPFPTWRQDANNTVVWANAAYMQLVAVQHPEEPTDAWPPRCLFPKLPDTDPETHKPTRIALGHAMQETPHWMDLHTRTIGTDRLCYAIPVSDLVRAEMALNEFIGTLGKTFAQLPTGLAIFDAKRRLVLFNPALIDLTALGAEVLTQRPTLHAFLDALRENQRIPEPRDYKSWRMRIAELEAEATDGRFQEVWSLPTGQTYRVTGQPHPDGAIAFLFEDISTEISLEREFRSEIDLSLSVLDAMKHGVAVFNGDGSLALANAEAQRLWNIDPNASPAIGLRQCCDIWGIGKDQETLVERLQSFVIRGTDREPFCFETVCPEGAAYLVQLRPLPRRSSLLEFHRIDAEDAPKAPPPLIEVHVS